MCRVAVAPCSPFSVTPQLMGDSAALARKHGVRLHTHVAETLDEERFCIERFGRRPMELMEDLGWSGDDVWYAHGIHLSDAEIDRVAESGTGIAHCPSSNLRLGAGACRVEDLVRAEALASGAGRIDGARATRTPTWRWRCTKSDLPGARAGCDPRAAPTLPLPSTPGLRGAWRRAGGAACLGRDDCGTLEVGKCADLAFFRVDDLGHAGVVDPLAGLALAPPARAEAVVVNGRVVVRGGRLLTGDEEQIAREISAAASRLAKV